MTTQGRMGESDYGQYTREELMEALYLSNRQVVSLKQNVRELIAMKVADAKSAIAARICSDFAALSSLTKSGDSISPDSWECLAYKLREELGIQEVA